MPFTVPGVHLLHTLQHMLYQMPRPKGFLKRITQYEFIAITHFLMDIIPITTQLNLDFEKEDLDLAAVNPVVETTLQHVKVARQTSTRTQRENKAGGSDSTPEEHVIHVNDNQKSTVQKAKNDFAVALEANFQKRFPKESMSVIAAFEVLSLRSLSLSQVQKLTIMAMKS